MMLRGHWCEGGGLNRTYLSTREKGTTPAAEAIWTTAGDNQAETMRRALSGGRSRRQVRP
jgi:hypothetical protein